MAEATPRDAVQALPKECFVRQHDILPLEVLKDTKVTVIGAGAIGSFTCMSLVKMGIGELEVYDHDTVELHNLPNQWYRMQDLERPKVDALAEALAAFGGNVTPKHAKFVGQSVRGIVVSAVDSMDARVAIWRHLKKVGKGVELYVDARMGAEVGKIITVLPNVVSSVENYEKEELYPSSEAVQAPCTAKATIYCAAGLSAFVAATIANHLCDRPSRWLQVVDFRNAVML